MVRKFSKICRQELINCARPCIGSQTSKLLPSFSMFTKYLYVPGTYFDDMRNIVGIINLFRRKFIIKYKILIRFHNESLSLVYVRICQCTHYPTHCHCTYRLPCEKLQKK